MSKYCFFFRPLADDLVAPLLALQFVLFRPRTLVQFLRLGWPRLLTYAVKKKSNRKERVHIFDAAADFSADRDSVCLFVHGGAWGSGMPWLYYLTAVGAARQCKCSKVMVLEYPTYPDATILQQADCIIRALEAIHGGDNPPLRRIFLVGHSSGANICALALLELGKRGAREINLITGFVALAGVFDVVDHFKFESRRGVAQFSPMAAAAGGAENYWECSPTLLVKQWSAQSDRPLASFMPRTLVFHGKRDVVVPLTSSQLFVQSLRERGVARVTEVYADQHDHTDAIYALAVEPIPGCCLADAISKFEENCAYSERI